MKPINRVRRKRSIACALAIFSVLALQTTAPVEAATLLDTANPIAKFTQEGAETFTAGSILTLNDASIGHFVSFFAGDADRSRLKLS